MKVKCITSRVGVDTLRNATSTMIHTFQLGDSLYEVEAGYNEKIENLTPIRVNKLEPPQEVVVNEATYVLLK